MKKIVVGAVIQIGVLVTAAAGADKHESPVAVEAIVDTDGGTEEPAPRRSVQDIDLNANMDLRRWPADHFYETLTDQMDALGSTHGLERREVLLDLAELFLGQAMLEEAASILSFLTSEDSASDQRWQALNDAIRLLNGRTVKESPLALPERSDRELWLALGAIAEGDEVALLDNIEGGFADLVFQSRPVARTLLPVLTEAAIELGNESLSALALDLLDEVPNLAGSPAGHYLRGRYAESLNNSKTAVEAYFESAKGWDRYAARGRAALADMALQTDSPGALLAARDVLESGSDAWRGDGYELLVLQRLADVYSELGDSVGALMAYGKLMLRFPNTPEAEEAGRKAAEDLDKVYKEGGTGRLPLAEWMAIHLKLVPSYRYFPDFAAHNEALADRALEMGGSALAATEYRRSLIMMKDLQLLPGQDIPLMRFNRVRFKLVLALAHGGLWQEARIMLTEIDTTQTPEMRNKLNRLKAKILSELGDDEGLLRTFVADPDATNLREVGRALFKKEQWSEAVAFYQSLWNKYPGLFRAEDASYLLIAASRADDTDTMNAVADAFPRLTESQVLTEMAASLLVGPPPLLPLRRENAAKRLENLERSLGYIKDSGL